MANCIFQELGKLNLIIHFKVCARDCWSCQLFTKTQTVLERLIYKDVRFQKVCNPVVIEYQMVGNTRTL